MGQANRMAAAKAKRDQDKLLACRAQAWGGVRLGWQDRQQYLYL